MHDELVLPLQRALLMGKYGDFWSKYEKNMDYIIVLLYPSRGMFSPGLQL